MSPAETRQTEKAERETAGQERKEGQREGREQETKGQERKENQLQDQRQDTRQDKREDQREAKTQKDKDKDKDKQKKEVEPDRSSLSTNGRDAAPRPACFAELVDNQFPVLHAQAVSLQRNS